MNIQDVHHSVEAQTTAANSVPSFPPLPLASNGRVRLGGQAPLFLPAVVADAGLVRLGGQSPTF